MKADLNKFLRSQQNLLLVIELQLELQLRLENPRISSEEKQQRVQFL